MVREELLRKKKNPSEVPVGEIPLIRHAEPYDAGGIISCMQAVMDEGVFLLGDYYLVTERMQKEMVLSRNDCTLVADKNKEIVGVLTIQRGSYRKNSHTGTLGIAIRKDFRQQGLGKKMMTAGLEWAKTSGIKKVNLEVFSTNLRAISLYKSLGFVEEGRKKCQFLINNEYVDDILMSLWFE